jgi:hypothetical protein
MANWREEQRHHLVAGVSCIQFDGYEDLCWVGGTNVFLY